MIADRLQCAVRSLMGCYFNTDDMMKARTERQSVLYPPPPPPPPPHHPALFITADVQPLILPLIPQAN